MPGNEKALKKPIIPRVGQEWEIWSSYVVFRIPTIFQLSVLGLILSSQIIYFSNYFSNRQAKGNLELWPILCKLIADSYRESLYTICGFATQSH